MFLVLSERGEGRKASKLAMSTKDTWILTNGRRVLFYAALFIMSRRKFWLKIDPALVILHLMV